MPPLKTVLFVLGFIFCAGGALLMPFLGTVGYVLHYNLGPERQWWHAGLRPLGIRYSYTLALLTAVGIVLNWRKLRFGKSILLSQEKLILLFLGVVWLSVVMGATTVERYTVIDHPSIKLTKIVIFVLMLSHVVTDLKKLDWLLWVIIIGALVLGLQAYSVPRRAFAGGRLETVGGSDFNEANRLGGYLGAMLFLIGVQFLRSKWVGKAVCFVAGAFAANGLVLTRSRGAVVGVVGGGIVALFLAPRKHRVKVLAGLVLAFLGALYLMDPQFIKRTGTITRPEEDRDASSRNRLEIWRGGVKMLRANPLGVGAGNFHQLIGRYAPKHPKRDAHSTYIRCGGELGFPGLALLAALIFNALRTLRRIMKRARRLPEEHRSRVQWMSYGLATSLVALLTYGITGTLIYFEALWWLLMLPTCLSRAVDNIEADQFALAAAKPRKRKAAPTGRRSGRAPGGGEDRS